MSAMVFLPSPPGVVLVQVDTKHCYSSVASVSTKPSSSVGNRLTIDANYFWGRFPIGTLSDKNAIIRSYPLKNPRATLLIYKDYAEVVILSSEEAREIADKKDRTIVQAGPTLVKDSKVCLSSSHSKEKFRRDVLRKTNHTAIGITKEGKLILCFCHNRTLLSVANIMKVCGCKNAMAFDGGSSAHLSYNNRKYGCLYPKTSLIFQPKVRSPNKK